MEKKLAGEYNLLGNVYTSEFLEGPMRANVFLYRAIGPLLAIWLFGTGHFAGQTRESQQKPGAAFKTRTELVQVAVLVQRSGMHVSGLEKSNFVVQQDGKDQPIATFEEVHAAGLPNRNGDDRQFGNTHTETAPRQITIIAIDTVNTPVMDQAYFHEELLKFLADAPDSGVPLGMVQLTRGGVRVLHDFTTDPKALLAAARKNSSTQPSTNADKSQALADLGNEASQKMELEEPGAERLFNNAAVLLQNEARMAQFQNRAARMDTLACLQQLAQALKAFPGRKTLLWAGSGYELFGGLQQVKGITDLVQGGDVGGSLDQNIYTWKLLNDANVAVYPIDTRRTVNTAYEVMDPSHHYTPLRSEREMARQSDREIINTFELIAAETGGKPCIFRTDLHNCLREAADDNAAYYLLGFYVDPARNNPGWHKINVKLDQKGALRYRSGFLIDRSNPEAARSVDLSLAANSPIDYTGLALEGRFTQFKENGGKKSVNFELGILPGSVTIEEESARINFDVVVVVRASGGTEVTHLNQRIERKLLPENIAEIKARGISYRNKIDIAPGTYGVWFVVRDNLTGRTGSVVVPLKVPGA
jgi:VWFA-related protein